MAIHFERTRECLKSFDFAKLFIEELGWSGPPSRKPVEFTAKDWTGTRRAIAELAGVVVLEIGTKDGRIPDAKGRAAIHKEIARLHHENLLIFVDKDRTQSLWYWVKRQDGKKFPRDHLYCKGQPGDLFLSKLGQIVFDLSEFDAEGNVSIVEVANRLRSALDVERVTKRFYRDFQEQHDALLELIQGVTDERMRRWYTSVLLNRLMFIYFLQKKGFLDRGDLTYLRTKLEQTQKQGPNLFFRNFLHVLFFEGFAKPPAKRSSQAKAILGDIRYLNGGLFLRHKVEQENPKLDVPDHAFEALFDLFEKYSWNLDDTPGGRDDEINPDVLGYIFEKYINQKAFGAYYTRTEITEYLCERTIHRLILDAVNTPDVAKRNPIPGVPLRDYATLGDMLLDLDAELCQRLLMEILPGLNLLDPACGSGAFLVAAMKTLINIYAAVVGKIKFLGDRTLTRWLHGIEKDHPSVAYFIKKTIITDNLYGVDLMEEAAEIARLRLFLALVASAQTVDQLEPLPNIDFNILAGNSLIGLLRIDDHEFETQVARAQTPAKNGGQIQGQLFRKVVKENYGSLFFSKGYRELLLEKNRLINNYRHATAYAEDLATLRDQIEEKKELARSTLDNLLLDEFERQGIKFEETTWDSVAGKLGKPRRRALKHQDLEPLHPFHWGYEFDEILHKRGGFDAILTNPPWEIFKPNGKEFFEEYSDLVSKKKMTIKDFEKAQERLLEDLEIRAAWLDYLSQFPHQSAWFRSAPQYKNQISIVNGKKAGTDINLYKLFLEQCYNLLKEGGQCGIIIPTGFYTDLGAKGLRELLFGSAKIEVLLGFSNERFIFEGVHHSFKFCLLTFTKGRKTESFEAAFRLNPREAISVENLDAFLHDGEEHIRITTELVRKLSPDSISVMEFRSDKDAKISEKMFRHPLLGQQVEGSWTFRLMNELHMTGDSGIFKESLGKGRLPLYEGKMIHQFISDFSSPRYWVNEVEGRRALLGRQVDKGQVLSYQNYRFVHRSIARTTDERTMIGTILPPRCFYGHSLNGTSVDLRGNELLFVTGLLNSLAVDYSLRLRISANLTMFFVYQLPVPRLTAKDPQFVPIAERVARLICTTPEFADLSTEVGLKRHNAGVSDPVKRAELRAELDGLIAHLYALTEDEFVHVLSTFPLVPDPIKVAAQNAYRDVERGLIQ
jgi:hypothetical protein